MIEYADLTIIIDTLALKLSKFSSQKFKIHNLFDIRNELEAPRHDDSYNTLSILAIKLLKT